MNLTTRNPPEAKPLPTQDDVLALQKEVPSLRTDPSMELIASLLVVTCLRNTVLEDYHTEWPQFTQEKMKVLMRQTVNKTYTVLCALIGGTAEEKQAIIDVLGENVSAVAGWDKPQFEQDMLRAMQRALRKRGVPPSADANKKSKRT
ncbi:MAG: hypothetical protein ACOYOU_05900 [Kiritimatiellia bacterium]